jgi:hypothetical protein
LLQIRLSISLLQFFSTPLLAATSQSEINNGLSKSTRAPSQTFPSNSCIKTAHQVTPSNRYNSPTCNSVTGPVFGKVKRRRQDQMLSMRADHPHRNDSDHFNVTFPPGTASLIRNAELNMRDCRGNGLHERPGKSDEVTRMGMQR